MSDEIECNIISNFGLGMSYLDTAGYILEIYGLNASNATIGAVNDKLIPEIKLCQQRPIDRHFPFVWLDAIHYRVKQDGGATQPKRFTRFWDLILTAGCKFWAFIYLTRQAQTSGFRC